MCRSSASGTVILGNDCCPEIPQKKKDDHHDKCNRKQQSELHFVQRGADGDRSGLRWLPRRSRAGIAARSCGSAALMRSTVSMTFALGCLKIKSWIPRLPFCQPASRAFSGPVTAWPISLHPNRRTVAPGQDDVVELIRLGELVVCIDRKCPLRAVDRAFRRIHRGRDQQLPHVFQCDVHGRKTGRDPLGSARPASARRQWKPVTRPPICEIC